MTTPSFPAPGFSPRGITLGRFTAAAAEGGGRRQAKPAVTGKQPAGKQSGMKKITPRGSATGQRVSRAHNPGRFIDRGRT